MKIGFDGTLGHAKLRRNFAVAQAFSDKADELPFTRGQGRTAVRPVGLGKEFGAFGQFGIGPGAPVAHPIETIEQIGGIGVLEDDPLHTQGIGFEQRRIVDRRRQQDYAYGHFFGTDRAQDIHSGSAGHLQIKQQDIRPQACDFP